MLDNTRQNDADVSGCTIWESTDEYSKKYRCDAAIYFLSYVSIKCNTIVGRMINALGYGKDIVDGINACDKIYLKGKICMFDNPEADDCNKRMLAHSMIGNVYYSLEEECKRLCEIGGRENNVKENNKYKKHESKKKLKKRFYYVQNKHDVMMTDLKKKVVGMRKKKLIGKSAMYNFRADPNLGIGKIAIRRILCACDGCLDQLNSVWKEGTIDE